MYSLPELPYSYNSLEPHIDALTMEIHHTKHQQAYVDNLNKALADYPELQIKELHELLMNLQDVPEAIREAVRNNGGGHLNHSMFWLLMSPNGGGVPVGKVGRAITKFFNSFEDFKVAFAAAAKANFGSGWTWLCVNKEGELVIISTPNQDNPISQDLFPILGLDTWEHAYYLHYQNKRADYIDAWWNLVNWEQVEENYITIME